MNQWIEIVKRYKWQTGLCLLTGLIGIAYLLTRPTVDQQVAIDLERLPSVEKEPTKEISSDAEDKKELVEKEETEVVVDVKGAVKVPGLYELQKGSRVQDAVQAAGGLTEQADPKSINLAQKVMDEGVVYVATVEEQMSVLSPAHANQGTSKEAGETGAAVINLNTATDSQLQTITGIGAKRAADIIAYREANGAFESVDELTQVSGIGEKSLEKIRPYVTVD